MSRTRYILVAILSIAVLAVTFQYSYYTNQRMVGEKNTSSNPQFSPGAPISINYPNPISQNVTLFGVMRATVVSPTCALTRPPCAISESSLYYLVVNGWNYRLIFPSSIPPPMNGARIIITGVFVTPSSFHPNQWTPQIYFRGDIYVLSFSYASPYL